jgi:hypothetical protein
MVAVVELFVEVYVLVDDAVRDGAVAIPARPGPMPSGSDAEVLTVAIVRHLLGRRSERAFLVEIRDNWRDLFPRLPHQSEFNRRVRWLWGALEQLRAWLLLAAALDPWQQVDTTAVPVKHPSRVRGREWWVGPNGLVAGFGWDAAHREWFYGFRLALRTDLGRRLVRAWGLVPAAVDERAVADDHLLSIPPVAGVLLDRGFVGRAFREGHEARGTAVVYAHSRAERRRLSRKARQAVVAFRNRIETTIGELTVRLDLDHHGAKTCWGLLTRIAGVLCAHTLTRLAHG